MEKKNILILKILLIILFVSLGLSVMFYLAKIKPYPITKSYTIGNLTYDSFEIPIKPCHATTFIKIFVAIDSPHIKFDYLNMSLDNNLWQEIKNINIDSCKNMDTDEMSFLGYINLNQLKSPSIKFYEKYYIPPQEVLLPTELEKNPGESIKACIIAKQELISNDIALRLLLFVAIVGGLISLTNFLFNFKVSWIKESENKFNRKIYPPKLKDTKEFIKNLNKNKKDMEYNMELMKLKERNINSFINTRISHAVLLFTIIIVLIMALEFIYKILTQGDLVYHIIKIIFIVGIGGWILCILYKINKNILESFKSLDLLQKEYEKRFKEFY